MADFVKKGRLFRVTAFNPSHRQLFLTSPALLADRTTTQIEVYIGHVELMFLKPIYGDGVHIRRATVAEFAILHERHGIPAENAEYTWMLDPDGDSFVVGSNPSWREAEYELMGDRNSLYSDEPWPSDFPMASGHVS
ncbi:hypothetical protein [Streptomyces griseus]|uniref:hypothetical protein n=1 Tax=Streptomyces griseus TaxID=1911 RepID=UPI0004C9B6C6|nr:hypothetical protein [Streptomyces griseus]